MEEVAHPKGKQLFIVDCPNETWFILFSFLWPELFDGRLVLVSKRFNEALGEFYKTPTRWSKQMYSFLSDEYHESIEHVFDVPFRHRYLLFSRLPIMRRRGLSKYPHELLIFYEKIDKLWRPPRTRRRNRFDIKNYELERLETLLKSIITREERSLLDDYNPYKVQKTMEKIKEFVGKVAYTSFVKFWFIEFIRCRKFSFSANDALEIYRDAFNKFKYHEIGEMLGGDDYEGNFAKWEDEFADAFMGIFFHIIE
jgi:hypothetical protein